MPSPAPSKWRRGDQHRRADQRALSPLRLRPAAAFPSHSSPFRHRVNQLLLESYALPKAEDPAYRLRYCAATAASERAQLLETLHVAARDGSATELHLHGATISDDIMVLLSSIVEAHPTLQLLDLTGAHMESHHVDALIKSIVRAPALRVVTMAGVTSVSPSCAKVIAQTLTAKIDASQRLAQAADEKRLRIHTHLAQSAKETLRKRHDSERKLVDIDETDARNVLQQRWQQEFRALQRTQQKQKHRLLHHQSVARQRHISMVQRRGVQETEAAGRRRLVSSWWASQTTDFEELVEPTFREIVMDRYLTQLDDVSRQEKEDRARMLDDAQLSESGGEASAETLDV